MQVSDSISPGSPGSHSSGGEQKVVALRFEAEATGDVISSAVHEDRFYFTIEGFIHKLVIEQSTFSDKIKVILDGSTIHETPEKGFFESIFADKHFEYSTEVRGVKLFVRRDDDVLDLFMDGVSFMKLLQHQRLKKADEKMKNVMENQHMAQEFFSKHSPEIDASPLGTALNQANRDADYKTPFDD